MAISYCVGISYPLIQAQLQPRNHESTTPQLPPAPTVTSFGESAPEEENVGEVKEQLRTKFWIFPESNLVDLERGLEIIHLGPLQLRLPVKSAPLFFVATLALLAFGSRKQRYCTCVTKIQ